MKTVMDYWDELTEDDLKHKSLPQWAKIIASRKRAKGEPCKESTVLYFLRYGIKRRRDHARKYGGPDTPPVSTTSPVYYKNDLSKPLDPEDDPRRDSFNEGYLKDIKTDLGRLNNRIMHLQYEIAVETRPEEKESLEEDLIHWMNERNMVKRMLERRSA